MEMKPQQYPLLVNWTLWETFQSKNSADYKANIQKIYQVGSLEEFAKLWNNIPYNKPGQFFYQQDAGSSGGVMKKINVNNEIKSLEAVSFFKNDIAPAWEDPENKKGGEFRITFDNLEASKVNEIWEGLVFDAIGGGFPFFEKLNGIRVMDSSKPPKSSTRFEIWTNFSSDSATVKAEAERQLNEYLARDEVIKSQGGYILLWKNH
jgi:hypothetical protein